MSLFIALFVSAFVVTAGYSAAEWILNQGRVVTILLGASIVFWTATLVAGVVLILRSATII